MKKVLIGIGCFLGAVCLIKGLVEQLEYEKYSHEDAVYAADNCGANWNEKAVYGVTANGY